MSKSNQDFHNIFFKNEYRKLAGKGNAIVFRLAFLLMITLTAIGFAVGGLNELSDRMDNPFTNWVDLDISNDVKKQLPKIQRAFQNGDTLDKYNLDGLGDWNRYWMNFYHRSHNAVVDRKDSLLYNKLGRTVDYEDDLFKEIINEKTGNLIYKNKDLVDEENTVQSSCGIIVTKELMDRLGYSKNEYTSIQNLSISIETNSLIVFIPLIGVVKELPSSCHFVSTIRMHNILQDDRFVNNIIKNNDSTSIRILSEQNDQKNFLREKIRKELKVVDPAISEEKIILNSEKEYYAYTIKLGKSGSPKQQQVQLFIENLIANKKFAEHSYIQCGEDADVNDYPHWVSFNFIDLNMVKPFQEKMSNDYNIKLTMEQVESRENFRLVTLLTSTIAIILFGLGLLSIILYLGNLIQSHISSIKSNLGTMKAMGLTNQLLQSSYRKIMTKLFVRALLFALPAALIIGTGINYIFLNIGFNLFHWSIPTSIIIIIVFVLILVRKILNNTLTATPGNLIYGRVSKNNNTKIKFQLMKNLFILSFLFILFSCQNEKASQMNSDAPVVNAQEPIAEEINVKENEQTNKNIKIGEETIQVKEIAKVEKDELTSKGEIERASKSELKNDECCIGLAKMKECCCDEILKVYKSFLEKEDIDGAIDLKSKDPFYLKCQETQVDFDEKATNIFDEVFE